MRCRIAVALLVSGLALGCAPAVPAGDSAPSTAPERDGTPSSSSSPNSSQAPALTAVPRLPRSPAAAAEVIEAAQQVIRAEDARQDDVGLAARNEQVALREVGVHPRWPARVLALLPRRMRAETRANIDARRQFRSMHPSNPADLATELPAWRIVAPPRARVLRASYAEAERRYGVDWEYLAAINLVETGFGRIRGTSSAGAQGPMQFMSGTWDMYGEGGDIDDPHDAVMAAARLLRANGFARDKGSALWRYNNSWAYVRGVTAYAENIRRRPASFRSYLAWEVYYLTQRGTVWLREGYATRRPIPVGRYLEHHPDALLR